MVKVFIELGEILENNPRFIDTRFDLGEKVRVVKCITRDI